jgi:hypothetical protein
MNNSGFAKIITFAHMIADASEPLRIVIQFVSGETWTLSIE